MKNKPEQTVVIIGAGLGGCFAAYALARAGCKPTIIECGNTYNLLSDVVDTALPAVTQPHLGCGLGGSTRYWHNGLIEIAPHIFKQWPFPKKELQPFYNQALPLLSPLNAQQLTAAETSLRNQCAAMGIPAALMPQALYYPRARVNAWHALGVAEKANLIHGTVRQLVRNGKRIEGVIVQTAAGIQTIRADAVILAAGGMGTPLLLQQLAATKPALPALKHAGHHYEDHPFAFVGEVDLAIPYYKLWNATFGKGNLRLPLVVEQDGLQVSFQLRPAVVQLTQQRRDKVQSSLNGLRNQPWNPKHWWGMLTRWDDIIDILSFKFGLRLPTARYSILMVAEQPPAPTLGVTRKGRSITREWKLSPAYLNTLEKAIGQLIKKLGPLVTGHHVFPPWRKAIQSSSHHSGTARMATSPNHGVCDSNGKVFGLSNLYVADGSLIPSSGFANTGLTIAALALRLGRHLSRN